jgi:K(+)-stimulated pyrophosphate-energized sodium pump
VADLDHQRGHDLHRLLILIPSINGDGNLWWKLSMIISCGTLAGAIIPEAVKVFTSTESRHVREIVVSSREGGASLNVLSGLVAGNFSAFWMGLVIASLMAIGYFVTLSGLGALFGPQIVGVAGPVFAFGLIASASSAWGRSRSRSIPTDR